MLRFLYVVPSKQSFDSSTDQGETANVERPFAAGRLQNTIGLGKEREQGETTNISFRLMLVKSGNALMSVWVIPFLRETHT